jgi:hypothetical protein
MSTYKLTNGQTIIGKPIEVTKSFVFVRTESGEVVLIAIRQIVSAQHT